MRESEDDRQIPEPEPEVKVQENQRLFEGREEFICKICWTHVVGCQPKLTSCCSNLFCGDCIARWFDQHPQTWAQKATNFGPNRKVPCPVCKQILIEGVNLVTVSKTGQHALLWRVISGLEIICENNRRLRGDGQCDWVGEYGTYQKHIKDCKNAPPPRVLPSPGAASSAAPASVQPKGQPLQRPTTLGNCSSHCGPSVPPPSKPPPKAPPFESEWTRLRDLETQLARSQQEILKQEGDVATLHAAAQGLALDLAERDRLIQQLRDEISSNEDDLKRLKQENEVNRSEALRLRQELASLQGETESCGEQLRGEVRAEDSQPTSLQPVPTPVPVALALQPVISSMDASESEDLTHVQVLPSNAAPAIQARRMPKWRNLLMRSCDAKRPRMVVSHVVHPSRECNNTCLDCMCVAHPKVGEAADCKGASKESQDCNTMSCPVDCQTSDWTKWSTCSPYCLGTQNRSRVMAAPTSAWTALVECSIGYVMKCMCNAVQPSVLWSCKRVPDRPQGAWGYQKSMGVRCDPAHQRTLDGAGNPQDAEALCSADPSCGGLYDRGCDNWLTICNVSFTLEHEEGSCSYLTRDDWQGRRLAKEWTPCKPCCNGTQTKTRKVNTPAAFGGEECGATTEDNNRLSTSNPEQVELVEALITGVLTALQLGDGDGLKEAFQQAHERLPRVFELLAFFKGWEQCTWNLLGNLPLLFSG
eukprot:symbB.v1.2.037087.t1/scaffold5382.1/size27800/2